MFGPPRERPVAVHDQITRGSSGQPHRYRRSHNIVVEEAIEEYGDTDLNRVATAVSAGRARRVPAFILRVESGCDAFLWACSCGCILGNPDLDRGASRVPPSSAWRRDRLGASLRRHASPNHARTAGRAAASRCPGVWRRAGLDLGTRVQSWGYRRCRPMHSTYVTPWTASATTTLHLPQPFLGQTLLHSASHPR